MDDLKVADKIYDYRQKDSIDEMRELLLGWAKDLDADYVNEFLEMYKEPDSWKAFCEKHKLEHKEWERCPDEIEDAGEVIHFETSEEADAYLRENGQLEEQENTQEDTEDNTTENSKVLYNPDGVLPANSVSQR